MYKGYNSMMHRGMESSKPGKALRMSDKENWTESAGGQAAGLVRASKARRRRTMMNRRPQGTGHSGGAGRHVNIPKVNAHGYYPLREES